MGASPRHRHAQPTQLTVAARAGLIVAGLVFLVALAFAGVPGGVATPETRPVSDLSWLQVVLDLEGEVPAAQLLGAPIHSPVLLSRLSTDGVDERAFRMGGAEMLGRAVAATAAEPTQRGGSDDSLPDLAGVADVSAPSIPEPAGSCSLPPEIRCAQRLLASLATPHGTEER